MFFPMLTRSPKAQYLNRFGKFYADYRQNHGLVSNDCQNRCVYCDILVEEMGYEGMQLDHFRPQHYFPELATDPYNLVLSCPKCNLLKSNDWPCEKTLGKPTFISNVGYINAFDYQISDFMEVEHSGKIRPLKNPTPYLIKRLALNRPSRCLVRKQRLVKKQKENLMEEITSLLKVLSEEMKNSEVDLEESYKKLKCILSIQEKLVSI